MRYVIHAYETGELLTANPFLHWKTQDIYSHLYHLTLFLQHIL